MAWTGSAPNQTYQRTDGVRTGAAINVTAAGLGVNDTAELADARENDFAAALNLVLKRDGGNQPSADLPMNTHKLTGMANGSARTDSVSLGQVQDGGLIYAEAGGTANAITLTTGISCTPVEGMVIGFVAEADSTTAVTVALNGGSALALQVGGAACVGGEVNNGQFHYVGYDGTQWQLLNPANIQPLNAGLTDISGLAKTDSNIIVGNGSNWVAESGATARTSLGLGTMAVETASNYLTKADNLGSVSSAATAFGNIKQAASDTATGVLEIAVQSEMETGTSTTLAVVPGRQHFHPGHPKCWAYVTVSGGTPTLQTSYNITSITDAGTGDLTITIATDFSSANWCAIATAEDTADLDAVSVASHSAGAISLRNVNHIPALTDPAGWNLCGYGDQA